MVKKSVSAFVLALIASIISIVVGFYTSWILVIIFAFAAGNQYVFFSIIGWLCILGGIIGIVGGSMCLKRANIGAILLTIVCATTGVALVSLFIRILVALSGEASSGATSVLLGVSTLVPAIMYIIATICAYRAKGKSSAKYSQQCPYSQNSQSTQNNVQMTQNDVQLTQKDEQVPQNDENKVE